MTNARNAEYILRQSFKLCIASKINHFPQFTLISFCQKAAKIFPETVVFRTVGPGFSFCEIKWVILVFFQ